MIKTKSDLQAYLAADAAANGRKSVRAAFLGDEIWKFQIALRKWEYYKNRRGIPRKLLWLPAVLARMRYHRLGVKLGFSIPANVFDKGLSIAHYGSIVVSRHAVIGMNCRIHEGVTIGATNGDTSAARIGNNVFLGSGAKVIGQVTIADDVAIAANCVVVDNIEQAGTTWGGIPAKKISDNNSHANLRTVM